MLGFHASLVRPDLELLFVVMSYLPESAKEKAQLMLENWIEDQKMITCPLIKRWLSYIRYFDEKSVKTEAAIDLKMGELRKKLLEKFKSKTQKDQVIGSIIDEISALEKDLATFRSESVAIGQEMCDYVGLPQRQLKSISQTLGISTER